MFMQPMLVLSYAGQYNPYMIADVASAVTDSQLNIVDVQQTALHGLSILTMIAETLAPDDSITGAHRRLQQRLAALDYEVSAKIVQPVERSRALGKRTHVFTLIGRDKVGILKAISNALANFRVSIDRMQHLARGELVVLELWVDASELRDLTVLRDVIQTTCDAAGFDAIIQPESPFRKRRRLVVFDMDSTLIEGEVIDELARVARVGEKVSRITAQAMAGKLDFQEALRQRVALLKGLPQAVLEEVANGMKLTPGAEEVMRTLKAIGFKTALISGGFAYFANLLKERLGFDYVFANELEIVDGVVSGRLNGPIIDKEAKGRILQEIAAKEGLAAEEVVAVGDGANDEIMLKNAGFAIAFNAKDILKKFADGQLTKNNLQGLLYCLGATAETVDEAAQNGPDSLAPGSAMGETS